jgi:hypothetical protein
MPSNIASSRASTAMLLSRGVTRLARDIEAARQAIPTEIVPAEAKPDGGPAVEPAADENVTSLTSLRQTK